MNSYLLLFAACLGLVGCAAADEEREEVGPVVSVEVAQADRLDLPVRVEAPAVVYAREEARIAARLTAPIRELFSRKGDTVRSGQILAQLDDRDLVAQRGEAAATLAEAQAALDRVLTGTLPADIQRAGGRVRSTAASLEMARANYDRRQRLYDQGAISERDLIASRTELAQAEAEAEVAETELRLLEEQSGMRDIDIAMSRRDQARSRLELIETQLDFAQIRSPFDGAITEQFLFPGDMTGPGTPIFTVAEVSTVVARAQLPEAEATNVDVGQACALTPADMPGIFVEGRVTVVNAAVDVRRRTLEVWCEIANSEGALRAGTFGTVGVTTGIETDAVVVPLAAVQLEEGSARGIVMIANADGTAEQRAVVTGAMSGGAVVIENGLVGTEVVIVEGGYGLPEGTRVEWEPDIP